MATRNPLTVLQVLPALESGGVEQGTLEIAEALVAAGHRSLVMSAGGQLVESLERQGTTHLQWDIGAKRLRSLGKVAPLRRLLRRERVDVLHLRSRLPAWIGWLAWRAMDPGRRPRLVTTVHGAYSVGRYSAIMTRGERVIVVSEFIRRYVLENYPTIDAERIALIHRGIARARYPYGFVPEPAWQTRWQAEGHVAHSERVVTLAARLTRLKGHDAFIELIEGLRSAGIAVRGLVVGAEDPRRASYAREVRARAAGAPVSFLGHRSDIREILAVSDVVVSLSTQPESFGRTALEALSLGTPVVGYDHGGVGEILSRLFPEGAVPVADRAATLAAVKRILWGNCVVPDASPFTLEAMQERTLALYESLRDEHPR